jgi:hypothetical protein
MKVYIYECLFDNGIKIFTRDLQEIVDYYNKNYDKHISVDYIYIMTSKNNDIPHIQLIKNDFYDFLKDRVVNEYGEDKINNKTKRSINRYYNNVYKRFKITNNTN